MDAMPLHPGWGDIALRLSLAVVAGAVIGLNRTERGRPAGLRTTILVCLAAAIAMIQANLILPTPGKLPDSFGIADILRFPLGVLSGIGFIGAGVILRRGDLVTGVTTAATMWIVTVIGLAIGGGQLLLGSAGAVLTVIVLWLLPFAERLMPRDHTATFVIACDKASEMEERVAGLCAEAGYRAIRRSVDYARDGSSTILVYELHWRSLPRQTGEPRFVADLATSPAVQRVSWTIHGQAAS